MNSINNSPASGSVLPEGRVLAVMPLRDGHSGKSRLASMASPAQRTAIIGALAHHVAGCLVRAPQVAEVLVVTNAADFARNVLPADAKITIAQQPAERPGLNNAAMLGLEHGRATGLRRVLTMHADLPSITDDDVSALIETSGDLVLAPDRLDDGTNAIVADTELAGFEFQFGAASFRAHRSAGENIGAHVVVVRRDGLAVDLDTVEDWRSLPASTRRWLRPREATQPDQ